MILLRFTSFGLALFLAVAINGPLQAALRRTGAATAADRLQIAISRLLCRALGLRVHLRGRPPAGALVVANHVSWTDILVLGAATPLCFVAKAEVATWPLLGRAVRAHGTLFVSRRRSKELPKVNRAIAETMRSGRPVVLFAEGTTGNGTRLEKFHSGHLGAACDLLLAGDTARRTVPVVPAALAYTRCDGLPTSHRDRLALSWMGDETLFPHLLALLRRRGPILCDLVFGETLQVARDANRKAVCADVRRQVHGMFGALVTGRSPACGAGPVIAAPSAIRSTHMNPVPQPNLPSGSLS